MPIATIKFVYRVAQYSLVGGCVSHTAYIGEEGEEPEYVYKNTKLSRCIPTKDKKERQELKSKILEIGNQLRYHLKDLIGDIEVRDTYSQKSPLGYMG